MHTSQPTTKGTEFDRIVSELTSEPPSFCWGKLQTITGANYFEAYSSRCPLHHGTSPESSGNWSVFAGGFAVVVSTEIGLNCNDVMEVRDGLCLGTENRTHFSDIFGLHDAWSCHRMVLGGVGGWGEDQIPRSGACNA